MEGKHIHMVGIGGIGMSALAQLYQVLGAEVLGSDRAASPITELLSHEGIAVTLEQAADNVADDTTLLVYSDAVPSDNPERARARELGVRECSYFEALGEVTREGTSIVVSGTHGKTSTTAMIAQILIDLGLEPTVIAGSILADQGSNFVAGKPDLFVIEGCEYMRHFLHLQPHLLVLTNIELDHTDYYKDLEDMQDAFAELVFKVPKHGIIVTDTESEAIAPVLRDAQARIVSYQDTAVPALRTPGRFSIVNAQAAKAAAQAYDSTLVEADIDRSLASFAGTWRRFEHKGTTKRGALLYDDYAHHPTAVTGTIELVREAFPDKKLVVVFHPHLYSRTKSFFNEFAEALSGADEVVLLPIYAAREAPDPSVSSHKLAEAVRKQGTPAMVAENLDRAAQVLNERGQDTFILTLGAGDAYKLADLLL
jgi:UDP-N-acetylmuramate--alanine ligase